MSFSLPLAYIYNTVIQGVYYRRFIKGSGSMWFVKNESSRQLCTFFFYWVSRVFTSLLSKESGNQCRKFP